LWGELLVRYVTVEDDDGLVLAFTPVYVGSNLNFNALLPKFIQKVTTHGGSLGSAIATRVAVVGSLISDRGWIPMHPDLTERRDAVRLLLKEIDGVAKEHHAQPRDAQGHPPRLPGRRASDYERRRFMEGFSLPRFR